MKHNYTGTANRKGEEKFGLTEGKQYEMDKVGKTFIVYTVGGNYITVALAEAFSEIKEL